jgi:isocitrate dehydrogenase
MMLTHIGQNDVAARVHNAWLKTIEDGLHTGDIFRLGRSAERVGTKGFADAVVARIGQEPAKLRPVSYQSSTSGGMKMPPLKPRVTARKDLVGVDIFVNWDANGAKGGGDALAALITPLMIDALSLDSIDNRGTKVWPKGLPETFCTDHWRLRLKPTGQGLSHEQIIAQLNAFCGAKIDFIKVEHLYDFDGQPGYTAAQGA